MTDAETTRTPEPAGISPWRLVIGLGLVSLFADVAADGGQSLFGPLLGSLGASALVIGLVSGGSQAVSLLLRLVSGPMSDRGGNHWKWTISGYAISSVCIPLLFITPLLGSLGLAVAASLILVERAGKAVRTPSKTAILADAAGLVGSGRGFGVHKALDLTGAFSGPLLVAAVLATTGSMGWAFASLAVPGVVTMLLLFWLRARVPDPRGYARAQAGPAISADPQPSGGLPREFFIYAAAVGLTSGGLVSYGVISFHLASKSMVPLPWIPIVYSFAMACAAVAALANGWAYDRWGANVLLVLPLLVACVPWLALDSSLTWVLVGMASWGFATGLQDSTVKALVARLVEASRRASAYGVFAAIQGGAALAGGAVVGLLYDTRRSLLVGVVAASQVVALVLLWRVTRRAARSGAPAASN